MGKDKLSKLYMGNINNSATEEDLKKFIAENGISENQITGIWLKKGFAFIDCLDQTTADAMIDKIHDKEFQGKKLLLEPSLTSGANQSLRARVTTSLGGFSVGAQGPTSSEWLKILIPGEYVGAIIGRAGANIKELTISTGARINILRNRPHTPAAEKTACIVGSPENCTAACRKILEICTAEAQNSPENPNAEVCLKILANNSLIGKIIGKDGRNIKKIMQETGTKIHVSHQLQSENLETNIWNPMNIERVITVRGSVDGMSKAEALISAKLKSHPGLDSMSFRSSFMPTSTGFYPIGHPGLTSFPFWGDARLGRFGGFSLNSKGIPLRL
jgi:insulin-like growth factor 2 mRNA-binding protein 1